MKAIAVVQGVAHSMHLVDAPMPTIDEIPDGRGVLVRVLRVGVDGTDREIDDALYGQAPAGADFLITGHESLGEVVQVGPNVPQDLQPGTLVVAMVRRPGSSVYDRIGLQDMTTDEVYFERGINLLHGFLSEYYVEDATYLVSLPPSLRAVGVLLEPFTIAQKGVSQAYEIQRRLKVWQPRRAAVIGAGTVSLLATLALRLRGLEVFCYSRRQGPYRNSALIEALGAHYVSATTGTLPEVAAREGPFDIIFEATGASPLVFAAMEALGKNGVLILSSITGGDTHVEVPADRINQGFVLGNKVMVGTVNAAHANFVSGVNDLILAEARFPGWLDQLLTTPISGLEHYAEMLRHLREDKEAIKVFVEVAEPAMPSRTPEAP